MYQSNKCQFVGNVGADPESSYIGSNETLKTTMSLATNEPIKVDGKWEQKTTWVRIDAFGKPAEWLRDRVSRGDKLIVECRYSNATVKRDDGTIDYYHNFTLKDFDVLKKSGSGEEYSGGDQDIEEDEGEELEF